LTPDEASLRFGPNPAIDCPRRNSCRPHKKLVGASGEEIYALLGEPDACSGDDWSYRLNGTCATEHDLLRLVLVEGRVVEVHLEHHFAEAACEPSAPPTGKRSG
jgi:hypothetical protein